MNWNQEGEKRLIQAILVLRSPNEAQRFLRDLMTEGEIEEFAKRFQAAEMLAERVPYSAIEARTGLSSTTVARVSRWLNRGMGGYKAIIVRMHRHTSAPLGRGVS